MRQRYGKVIKDLAKVGTHWQLIPEFPIHFANLLVIGGKYG